MGAFPSEAPGPTSARDAGKSASRSDLRLLRLGPQREHSGAVELAHLAAGDATTGDTNLSTVQVSYSVKPCSNGQTVTVDTQVALLADQTQKVYEQTGAALSGRFTTVVVANTSYLATVTVHDADTGDLVGSSTIFVAALRKRV